MQAITHLIVSLKPFLPLAVVGLILIAVAILWYLFTVLRAARKRMAIHDASAAAAKADAQAPGPAAQEAAFTYAPPSGDLRQSFAASIRLLKAHVSGKNYRYQIPWFLMLGQAGSGKTTVLRNTELHLPMGEPLDEGTTGQAGCLWWFFDRGVVLDVSGDYVLRKDGISSDVRGWGNFLKTLRRYRPERPIDGVVLTIPCSDLILPPGEDDRVLARKKEMADLLYRKLWEAQKTLGVSFPVYVLVTKCDEVTGFTSLARELPALLHQGIFGWSSPYTVETGFTSGWTDEAFQGLLGRLHQVQSELFAQVKEVRDSDGLFLFPSEFQKMLEGLRVCLNQVFRPSVYHESFFLRGLYFCGDPQAEPVGPVQAPSMTVSDQSQGGDLPALTFPVPGALRPAPPSHAAAFRPCFLKHLFERKVFPEFGLGRATSSSLLAGRSSVRMVQVALAVVLVAGSLGLWRGYHKLHNQVGTLMPVLRSVVVDLRKSRELFSVGNEAERSALQRRASVHLLEGMSGANANSLKSAFFLSSWFSPVHTDLSAAMTVAYDEIILRSICLALNQKARDLLATPPAKAAPDTSREADLRPTPPEEMPGFLALRGLVAGITELERQAGRYNGLKNSGELTDLSGLVQYVYGIELPADFFENAEYYHAALSGTQYRVFELSGLRDEASRAVRDNARAFFDDLFQSNALMANLRSFHRTLEGMDQRRLQKGFHPTDAGFQDLMASIRGIEAALSSPPTAWVFGEGFDAGPGFGQTLLAIENSALLGPEAGVEVQGMGERGFARFREDLAAFETPLTGPVLKSDSGRPRPALSESVVSLKTVLTEYLRHDLAGPEPGRVFRAEVPPGTRLVWDPRLLEEAVRMAEPRPEADDHMRMFPVPWQNTLKRTAAGRLRALLVDLMAQAQGFEPVPAGEVHEEDLRAAVRNFREASAPISALLSIFDRMDFADPYEDLSDLAVSQASDLLTGVDRLLDQEGLYEVGDFTAWDGRQPISSAVFGARDASDMSYYLDVQRERVKYLADEYAEPLVQFLGNRKVSRGQVYVPVLARWQRILSELRKYDSKKPGNSLATLESFILSDMDQVRLDNFTQKVPPGDLGEQSGDFFLQRRNRLRKEVYERCQGLAEQLLVTGYGEVERFFNQTLAGKFPFAGTPGPGASGEAGLDDVVEFYRLYDQRLWVDQEFLRRSKKLGGTDRALAFLYEMEKVRGFLLGGRAGDEAEGAASVIDLDVEFRVNARQEVGGNQVMDWSVEVGDQRVTSRDVERRARWSFGEPVRVVLRWAKDSPEVPVQPGRPEDRTAAFEYTNRWALISLIRSHPGAPSDFGSLVDPKPHTLKFLIPTRPSRGDRKREKGATSEATSQARVYLRITPVSPDGKERKVLPPFPEKAPPLGQEKVSRKE